MVSVLALGLFSLAFTQETTNTTEPVRPNLDIVLGLIRPLDTDILFLKNGDQLTGTILNDTFSIHTSYAQLSFNNQVIAGIDLEDDENNIGSIITINNDRFSGFINDAAFVLKLRTGPQIEIRREKVFRVIFGVRDQEREGIPQRQFITLKNGDFFSGLLLNSNLVAETTYADVPLDLSTIKSITFTDTRDSPTTIRFLNGDSLQGILNQEDLLFSLDVGGEAQVYQDHIKGIFFGGGLIPDLNPTSNPFPIRPQLLEPRTPYRENRERPLAVLIDNVGGYPQSGLVEASEIIEMPVEGGLTRLMAVFDRLNPDKIGPISGAQVYFYELVQSLDGILVHDGGSPAALAAISRNQTPTLNAYYHGELFSRQEDRRAPYNLYAGGPSLRDAVNRLELGRTSVIRGEIYQPAAEVQDVSSISMRYSRTYTTGFAYQESLNLYRWLRNGEPAVDASGEAVLVDAVLLAKIDARPLPDDPEGRLYIPLRGGPATLYVRGKAITGEWHKQDGIQFVDANGEVVDLAPFKLWVVFTPNNDNHATE